MSSIYPNAVVVKDLDFGYQKGGVLALSGVSLNLSSGTVLAVLGPNGAGKTTLLHLLLGRLLPWKGKISMYGRLLLDLETQDRSRLVGFVPQSEAIPFPFCVLDYVLLGRASYLNYLASPSDEDRQMAMECLEDLGVGLLRDRPVNELGEGERRIVQLARTLIQQTRIVLIDEPVSHLDPINKSRMVEIINLLGKAGKTVIFSTHDPGVAATAASRILLLGRGRAWAEGSTQEVLTPENMSDAYETPMQVTWLEELPLVRLSPAAMTAMPT